MALTLLPDAELLVTGFLRAHPDIAALGADVTTSVPPSPSLPLIRALRVGGSPTVRQWLDVARVQTDCWAASKEAAHTLARTVQAVMHTLPGLHDLAVVTAVEDGVFAWQPDPDTGWAGYTADFQVYLHPTGPDGS